MTRAELLRLVVAQARSQGFEFRRWYVGRLGRSWPGAEEAVLVLAEERRYYALLFSHEFATSFWKAGTKMTLQVQTQSFPMRRPDGSVTTVERKGYMRRMTREDAWRFHLKEMAVKDEPLRYIRRFLRVEEEVEVTPDPEPQKPMFLVDEEDLLPDD